jgi:hypothetical protein
MELSGFESQQGLRIFLFTTAFRPVLGPTLPLIQWVAGALSLEEKRPWREADHSPQLKNTGTILPLPFYLILPLILKFSRRGAYLNPGTI